MTTINEIACKYELSGQEVAYYAIELQEGLFLEGDCQEI